MPIIEIDPVKKAVIDNKLALAAVDDWFREQTVAGFTTNYGWRLGLTESDVTLLTGAFVLAKEAAMLELPLPQIVDAAGVAHTLTMQELTGLMLAYGQYRAGLSAEYASRKAALEAAAE
jgi:hypothetical protein